MIGYLALAITAAIMVAVCARIDNWSRDWTQNFSKTSPTAEEPFLRPLRIDRQPDDLAKRIAEWAESKGGWDLLEQSRSARSIEIHLTRTTPLLRFVDDIHITISETEASESVVNATSQSRFGKGDLGQNPRNLRMVLDHLRGIE